MDIIFWVQASRVQASGSPEFQTPRVQASRRPDSKQPGVQSPRVPSSKVQATRPCVQSPAFPICRIKWNKDDLISVCQNFATTISNRFIQNHSFLQDWNLPKAVTFRTMLGQLRMSLSLPFILSGSTLYYLPSIQATCFG